jgi:hypothetical protein
MAVYADREAFIPYRKADIIELCAEDGRLSPENVKKFREFCEIVGSYYHFDFHKTLESFKNNFAPYDPDSDTKARIEPTENELRAMEFDLKQKLNFVLERANYTSLTEEELTKALNEQSLITLNLNVNFDDFEFWSLYHRGNSQQTVDLKKLFGIKHVPFTMDIYERVVLLIKFKDEEYFLKKFKGNQKKLEALNFTPGKMYIYMYKNIPQADLEILFPNVEISMNKKDKIFFGVPAVFAGGPLLAKIATQLPLIFFAISALATGATLKDPQIFPALTACLSLLIAVFGLIFKQYVKFKNKKIKFLKDVTDTLFFKNLVSNSGVFNSLIDSAEEEECKEVFLAFYHLLVAEHPLTQEELDDTIEEWLENKFNTKIDFDVEKALEKLQNLRGKILEGAEDEEVEEQAILTIGEDKKCRIVSIDDAKTIIDYIWDNIYQYNE